jgi:hypothetical protein
MENPNAEEVIANIVNIASTLIGGEKAPEIKAAIKDAVPSALDKPITPPTIPPINPVEAVTALADKVAPAVDTLKNKASDVMTSIDTGTQTVLDPTKKNWQIFHKKILLLRLKTNL